MGHAGMQGTLRVGRFNSFEARLACDSLDDEIVISGRVAMNRALDGDVVAVELLPEVRQMMQHSCQLHYEECCAYEQTECRLRDG